MTKPHKITLASAIAVAGIGLTIAGSSFAATDTKGIDKEMHGNRPALTQEQRDKMHTERKTLLEEKLAQAVKDGKLTDDQKSHILDSMEQAHTKIEAKDRDGAKQIMDDLKKWIEDNKIDTSILPPPPHQGRGHGHMGHPENEPNDSK